MVSQSLTAALVSELTSHFSLAFPDMGFSFPIYCWPKRLLAVASLNLVPNNVPLTYYSKNLDPNLFLCVTVTFFIQSLFLPS